MCDFLSANKSVKASVLPDQALPSQTAITEAKGI